ncbi:MAG: peptide ABC transporter substrate-binding protein [Chloroflexota bacterium]|nr:peptide ABC transporter substrate-binding protein [Chloroflexota bacterium]
MGGTLRIFGGQPPTLDPAMVQDSTSAEYVVHLYSGLVALNEEQEIVPDLASKWELGGNGTTYTFYLLEDARFADGSPITAEDIVYSIERACSPELASPVAEPYLGDIVGAKAFMTGEVERISGLEIVDAHTLQIEIDAPKAYFLAKLSYPAAFVVDEKQIREEGTTWLQAPNGSGPFILEHYDKERIVLARNENYYGQKPALQKVEYTMSDGTPITMYENDVLDIVIVPPSEIERVADPYNPLHDELVQSSELSLQYLGMNVTKPPFDDVEVRQAFAQAIDKQKLTELVLSGMGTPALGILPPDMPGYNESLRGLRYDPQAARENLAHSRYGTEEAMPDIVLTISGTSGHMPDTTRAIHHMISESLGLDVMVQQVDWPHFLDDLSTRRYQMFSTGWIADYPDPQDFLDILFHSKSAQNHTGYHNQRVDDLLEEARTEDNAKAREELYREAERIIVREAPIIPLYHNVNYHLVKPYVKGFTAGAGLRPWLKDIYFQE